MRSLAHITTETAWELTAALLKDLSTKLHDQVAANLKVGVWLEDKNLTNGNVFWQVTELEIVDSWAGREFRFTCLGEPDGEEGGRRDEFYWALNAGQVAYQFRLCEPKDCAEHGLAQAYTNQGRPMEIRPCGCRVVDGIVTEMCDGHRAKVAAALEEVL